VHGQGAAGRRGGELLAADLVVWSDGPVDPGGGWRLVFGVRGIASFELRARGANRSLHSGNWGGVAPNPLWTLVHLLATMRDAQGRITVDGFGDEVEPLGPAERAPLDRLPVDVEAVKADLGLERLDAPVERGFAERLAAWPTLTINGLHGGYGGQGTQTVLPAEAVAKCDVRLVHAQRAGDVYDKLDAHVRRHAPGVELVRQGSMEPSRTPMDSPWTAPIRAAMAAAQGAEPLLVPVLGGSLPLHVFTGVLGLPTFGIPLGNPDQANHAPNENLDLERFHTGIKTAAAVLAKLGLSQGSSSGTMAG
jgi:acetylornithine deacetylase/succinyl-diaminopimelate desuccinylase-like protein